MQFILTEEEYAAMIPIQEAESMHHAIFLMRKEILDSNNFVCVHDRPLGQLMVYCDDCPVYKVRKFCSNLTAAHEICPNVRLNSR